MPILVLALRVILLALLFVGGQAPGFAARYPTPRGWVNDFAGVMDSRDVERLTTALSDFEQHSGIEVAVVTLPSVPDGDIDQAAADLFKEWGIGKRGQNNGVLILCSVGDRRIRIEVGYGLEHVLTDAKSGRLIDDVILPRFRAGDFSGGLAAGGIQLIALLGAPPGSIPTAPLSPTGTSFPSTIPWDALLAILLFAGIWIYVWREIWHPASGDYWYDGWSWGDFGGGFGGGSSGGFGGFGGGSSGGGGASRGW